MPEPYLRIRCHSFDYRILSERKIGADVRLLARVVFRRNPILLKVAADGDSFDYQVSIWLRSCGDGDAFDDQTSIQLKAHADGDAFDDQTSIQLKVRADDDAFDDQVRIQLKAPADGFLVACLVSTVKYC